MWDGPSKEVVGSMEVRGREVQWLRQRLNRTRTTSHEEAEITGEKGVTLFLVPSLQP